MTYIETIGVNAKKAESAMRGITQQQKNNALTKIANSLTANTEKIIAANKTDLENAAKNNMSAAMQDRLRLDQKRISGTCAKDFRRKGASKRFKNC